MWRVILALALVCLVAMAPAEAASKPMIVSIHVVDADGLPIQNAWVRVPETEGRRDVDPESGIWATSLLYGFDGEPIVFVKGMVLDIEISAPGYVTQTLKYKVRARRNDFSISLERMPEREVVVEDKEDLSIDWFQGARSFEKE